MKWKILSIFIKLYQLNKVQLYSNWPHNHWNLTYFSAKCNGSIRFHCIRAERLYSKESKPRYFYGNDWHITFVFTKQTITYGSKIYINIDSIVCACVFFLSGEIAYEYHHLVYHMAIVSSSYVVCSIIEGHSTQNYPDNYYIWW